MKTKLAILAVVAALTVTAPDASAANDIAAFKDWRAACDNTGACMAVGFTKGEYASGPYLVVRREGGPGGEAVLSFVLVSDTIEPKEGDSVTLTATNFSRGFTLNADVSIGDSGPKVDILAKDVPALMAALQAADTIEVEYKGAVMGEVSLAGSSAALRWMDDRQGRAGGVTALVAKGAKPASSVPAARAVPVVRLGPAVGQDNLPAAFPAVLAGRADVKACAEEQADPDGDFGKPEAQARLTAGEYLWAIPCGRGAYNFSALYVIAGPDGSGARSPGLGDDDTLTNGGYDAESRTLGAFNKGRGLGDCGQQDEWAWDGQRFRATLHARMNDCRAVSSDHWLVTWRANTR